MLRVLSGLCCQHSRTLDARIKMLNKNKEKKQERMSVLLFDVNSNVNSIDSEFNQRTEFTIDRIRSWKFRLFANLNLANVK